jgi:hypothetical protein
VAFGDVNDAQQRAVAEHVLDDPEQQVVGRIGVGGQVRRQRIARHLRRHWGRRTGSQIVQRVVDLDGHDVLGRHGAVRQRPGIDPGERDQSARSQLDAVHPAGALDVDVEAPRRHTGHQHELTVGLRP